MVYLDSHDRGLGAAGAAAAAAAECEVHRFEPSAEGAGAIAAAAAGSAVAEGRRRPGVSLLYRPGHYEIVCAYSRFVIEFLGAAGAIQGICLGACACTNRPTNPSNRPTTDPKLVSS